MKKTEAKTTTGLALCLAVSETADTESTAALRIYDAVQSAIDRNAAVIYNGNDETIDVPFIAHIIQMHPDFVRDSPEYDGPFEGWETASHLYMVEASRCPQDKFIDLVTEHFSDDIISLWAETLRAAQTHPDIPIFLGDGCVAIHIDNTDESWFEYIIESV